MKKLSLKVMFGVILGILGVSGMSTFAQTPPMEFGDVGGVVGVGVPGADAPQVDDRLIDVIKNFINRMLGILALIALIILLWGGFQMVTAAGDDTKYKKGFKILQQAAIGLVFIGVSRLVVSLIFWVIGVAIGTP